MLGEMGSHKEVHRELAFLSEAKTKEREHDGHTDEKLSLYIVEHRIQEIYAHT